MNLLHLHSRSISHSMLEFSTKSQGARKHLPASINKDLLANSVSKCDDTHPLSSNGRSLMPTSRSNAMGDYYLPGTQSMALTVSAFECAPPALTFPLSRETSISMNLCGQVVTYNLKSLGINPQVIIELLKVTKSECASWMIVSAFYRRRGEPRNGISVMKSFIEERIAGGIQAESDELRPAFLLLSGCETDLARLAKTKKAPESVMRGHYTAAQEYLQKVFKRADHLQSAENKHKLLDTQLQPGSLFQSDRRIELTRELVPQPSTKTLEREIQFLRERHDGQEAELAQLRTLKRQLEDDCSYERNIRRKYQRQLDDLEKECESARKMERYALDQIKREVATRRKAEEVAELERKMRQELIQISDKRFGSDIINLWGKKKQDAENI